MARQQLVGGKTPTGTAGSSDRGPAVRAAKNRGKAALALGPPPFGGPKGKGGLATPRPAGPPAKKAPITGPMQGVRGRQTGR